MVNIDLTLLSLNKYITKYVYINQALDTNMLHYFKLIRHLTILNKRLKS